MNILPNWHPIFVHFTVALIGLSALLHIGQLFLNDVTVKANAATVARWNLWLGAIITLGTVVAGFFAYNTVNHDTPSHLAMTEHKNWAIATTIVLVISAALIFLQSKKSQAITLTQIGILLVCSGLVGATAWHGGELVYRYGLGVLSMPKTDAHDHGAHGHGDDGHGHGSSDASEMPSETKQHGHGDDHAHDDGHPHEGSGMSHAHEAAIENHHNEKPHAHSDSIDSHDDKPHAHDSVESNSKEHSHSDGHAHEH